MVCRCLVVRSHSVSHPSATHRFIHIVLLRTHWFILDSLAPYQTQPFWELVHGQLPSLHWASTVYCISSIGSPLIQSVQFSSKWGSLWQVWGQSKICMFNCRCGKGGRSRFWWCRVIPLSSCVSASVVRQVCSKWLILCCTFWER